MSLSLKKKRQLKKESENKAYRDALAAETGLYFSQEITSENQGFPFLKYIVNALALFGGTFGSLYCLISAFELDLNIFPMVITCIAGSIILSFMYISYRAKIITYLLILLSSVTLVVRFFTLINSGISDIRNNILTYIDGKVSLPYLREYTVYFNDEYVAMSAAVCVLALALMILLNIVISEKMSLRGLFALTFPILQCGMYFNFSCSKAGMVCVAASWVLVAGVKMTNAYDGLNYKMVGKSSVKKHRHYYSFASDPKNISRIAVVWLGFILIVTGVVFAAVPSDNFELSLPTDFIKDSTNRTVKNFLSYGFSSMYSMDRESSSPGQLSNVSAISFDGKTDLEVTMVDYRASRVYLRNYVGYEYDPASLSWKTQQSEESLENEYNYTAKLLQYDYNHNQTVSASRHKIGIKVTDSDLFDDPLNVAYYSVTEGDDLVYPSSGQVNSVSKDLSEAAETKYYDFYVIDKTAEDYRDLIDEVTDTDLKEELTQAEENLRRDAEENALSVPENNIEAIETFCKAYNISADDDDVISEVVTALEENYEYTLRPGKVPYGEDYINYFLLGSQKGYCQHFASAATLIFRYLGIPARYAEGYAVDAEDFYTAQSERDLDFDEWIDTPYRSDSEVMTVSVPDSHGHAWVEVYEDGIGWTVVEATTAVSSDGSSVLSSIFSRNSTLSEATRNIMQMVTSINVSSTRTYLIRLLITVIVLAVLAYIIRMLIIVISRRRRFGNRQRSLALTEIYNNLYETAGFAGIAGNNLSYRDFTEVVKFDPDFCKAFEKAVFSGREPDEEEFRRLTGEMKEKKKELVSSMKNGRKFRYIFINILW